MVGFISDKPSHVFVFSLGWVFISLVSLFTFQRKEFVNFEKLVNIQEAKYHSKTTIDSKLVWVLITSLSAFAISFLIGLLIVLIK